MSAIFEDFGTSAPVHDAATPGGPTDLSSFDTGYKAGWDDASKAQQETVNHISSVLSQNIETMEFTMIEARGLALKAMAPVLGQIADTLLPGLKADALREQLVSHLETLLQSAAPETIQLEIAAEDEAGIKKLLDAAPNGDRVALKVKDTLAEGQVYVSCEDRTHLIDIPKALDDIRQAFDAAIEIPQENMSHAV